MKMVIDPKKHGVAAKKITKTSSERLRNPAIKSFAPTGASKQILIHDDMSGMGDWWDDITAAVSTTATKAWDSAVTAGQTAATKLVQQQLVKIIGTDGKVKEVAAGSPEAVAYTAQQAAQQTAINNTASENDKMMKYMMYGMGGIGVLLVGALVFKMVKK